MEIRLARGHVFRTSLSNTHNGAVVVCNDGVDFAASLIRRWQRVDKGREFSRAAGWIVLDLFAVLNDWPQVLKKVERVLMVEVSDEPFAGDREATNRMQEGQGQTATVELAQSLQKHKTMLLKLHDIIGYTYLWISKLSPTSARKMGIRLTSIEP